MVCGGRHDSKPAPVRLLLVISDISHVIMIIITQLFNFNFCIKVEFLALFLCINIICIQYYINCAYFMPWVCIVTDKS